MQTVRSSVLANCEIAQLQQTTEILQQSYITQILYKLLAPDVWYIWCIAKCWHKVWPPFNTSNL